MSVCLFDWKNLLINNIKNLYCFCKKKVENEFQTLKSYFVKSIFFFQFLLHMAHFVYSSFYIMLHYMIDDLNY